MQGTANEKNQENPNTSAYGDIVVQVMTSQLWSQMWRFSFKDILRLQNELRTARKISKFDSNIEN